MIPEAFTMALFGLGTVLVGMVRRRKTRPENLPEHPARGRMIDFVYEHPGAQLKEICQDLDVNRGTATYHLRLLEDAGIIEGLEAAHAHRYFPAGMPDRRKRQLALLRREHILDVVEQVKDSPGILQKDIRRHVGLPRKRLRRHLNELVEEGILLARPEGSSRRFYPTASLDALCRHLKP